LDSLPDAIIIANKKKISYLNQQAWKLLNCQSNGDDVIDINEVFCLDTVNCSILTPVD
jgi:nitrogen-specific signal transduction histidine kinase